ncbi:hypothetical protein HAX54_005738 [Datura stramonium]|uniref:Uncharacterized protein n=1 Tax=Datura stramonium TaxID=4076 RepID=A0ABS8RUD0_DATST|nr:hypothetical protein [Datura stramonium]
MEHGCGCLTPDDASCNNCGMPNESLHDPSPMHRWPQESGLAHGSSQGGESAGDSTTRQVIFSARFVKSIAGGRGFGFKEISSYLMKGQRIKSLYMVMSHYVGRGLKVENFQRPYE